MPTEAAPKAVVASVIIPHLNTNRALERCLQSVLRQREEEGDVEVIVVDNGSAEAPHSVQSLPRTRLLFESVAGPGPARNAGAAAARGKILLFIDADCIADAGWLDAAVARFADDKGAQVVGGRICVAPASAEAWTPAAVFEALFAFRQRRNVKTRSFAATANMAVRADVFEAVGPFAGIDLPEDRDWCERAVREGLSIDYCSAMLVHHPARSSTQDLRLRWLRHVYQEHQLHLVRKRSKIRWMTRALLVLLSAPFAVPRLLFAPGSPSLIQRLAALPILFDVRLLRCREMLRLSSGASSRPPWNAA